jgi:hypothetical protein
MSAVTTMDVEQEQLAIQTLKNAMCEAQNALCEAQKRYEVAHDRWAIALTDGIFEEVGWPTHSLDFDGYYDSYLTASTMWFDEVMQDDDADEDWPDAEPVQPVVIPFVPGYDKEWHELFEPIPQTLNPHPASDDA